MITDKLDETAIWLLEAELAHVRAEREHYRALLLEAWDQLGLVAEYLAQATDWQPSEDAILPDPVQLAEVVAQRLHREREFA